MMKHFKILLLASSIALTTNACKDGGKIKYYPTLEEQNRGTLDIYCDESLQSIVQQQAEIFELNFPEAKVNPIFLNERALLEKLLNGSARTALLTRKLSEAELQQIAKVDSIKGREHYIAKSALVPITNKSAFKQISNNELKALFTNGTQPIVIEGKQSDRLKAVASALGIAKFSSNIFAVNGVDSVLQYIEANPNAIGLIDYAHISDEFSAKAQNIFNKISLLKIETHCHDTLQVVSANPNDIFTDCYPLVTPLNYVVTDYKNKLSLGFVNFMVKSKASRVFLHAGYIPAVMPQREVVIDTTSDIATKQYIN
ncbi:MAG: substrate-binding domain-containing protein [Chitinophagales bacterium]